MSNEVKLLICGDFCPVRGGTEPLLQKNAEKKVFGDFYEIIRNADLAITNLECPLTVTTIGINKIGPNLKTSPDVAALLKTAGFDGVTLANNHIFDYGQEGLEETLRVLHNNGIAYVGAGKDAEEAQQTYYTEINGLKITIVNFCEIEYSCADTEHGGANPMHIVDNCRQIQAAANNADHVLVIIHGGHEHHHYPSPETLKRYRFYAEHGASAVIAHHTHCLGGHERWKGVPIFYSLGNFFFPGNHASMPSWYEGYAVLLKVTKASLSFDILPYEQCKGNIFSIDCTRGHEIAEKIEKINSVIQDPELFMQKWKDFVESRSSFLAWIAGFGKYQSALLRKFGLINYCYNKTHLSRTRQILRCEAHRELARELIRRYFKSR